MKFTVIAPHYHFKPGDTRECHKSVGEILKRQNLVIDYNTNWKKPRKKRVTKKDGNN